MESDVTWREQSIKYELIARQVILAVYSYLDDDSRTHEWLREQLHDFQERIEAVDEP